MPATLPSSIIKEAFSIPSRANSDSGKPGAKRRITAPVNYGALTVAAADLIVEAVIEEEYECAKSSGTSNWTLSGLNPIVLDKEGAPFRTNAIEPTAGADEVNQLFAYPPFEFSRTLGKELSVFLGSVLLYQRFSKASERYAIPSADESNRDKRCDLAIPYCLSIPLPTTKTGASGLTHSPTM
ncbi:unnamed protein product [Cochlearia groenlandica]